VVRTEILRSEEVKDSPIRCAIYTRKSSEEGLEQSFNSLDAQREACEAYILSQRHEGWQVVPTKYDDGGFSGGNIQRPALKRLLDDIAAKRIDTVVVYKVDRLTRSLADFAKIVEQFDGQGVSFVSVTQQFNTTTSMGRLTLNVLLSFAQFEREVTGERIRDKIAASKKKGMWMGGTTPLGYDLQERYLVKNDAEAAKVNQIYQAYLQLGCVSKLRVHLDDYGIRSKYRVSKTGNITGDNSFSRGALYEMLRNRIYLGEISHKGASYPGQHPAILDRKLWDQVQEQLKANLQAPRKQVRATEQSLLAGLLFDQDDNRFIPSHTAKKGKRYRYYISQAVIKGSRKKINGPQRLPAEEIEHLITAELRSLFQSPKRMLELLVDPEAPPNEVPRVMEALKQWVSPDRVHTLLKTVLHKVVVLQESVDIYIDTAALHKAILGESAGGLPDSNGLFKLEVSACFQRTGDRAALVVPPDSPGAKPHVASSLVKAIARAHDWVERIAAGEVLHQRAIAAVTGLDERYISRILPLAFLAPDITEGILEGRQSDHASLQSYIEKIPANWREQRLTRS
jgi:DNA invertase Pin-like site-specific DNA recombinase